MLLNIISTTLMVRLGKVYKNYMVDLQASNSKLMKRATRLVSTIADCDEDTAIKALEKSHLRVKQAVLNILKGLDFESATKLLDSHNGFLRDCLVI
jgi:N-acetylmuramic acid 6-phosphate etherase